MQNPLGNFSIPIGKEVVWVLFFLTSFIVIGMAFVFNYHWKYYGLGGKEAIAVKSIYAAGTFILLALTFVLATMY